MINPWDKLQDHLAIAYLINCLHIICFFFINDLTSPIDLYGAIYFAILWFVFGFLALTWSYVNKKGEEYEKNYMERTYTF